MTVRQQTQFVPAPLNEALVLRDYQREAIEAVVRDWDDGHRGVLVVIPTGGGKTEVFTALLLGDGGSWRGVLGPSQRALILSHRTELVQQPVDRVLSRYPSLEGQVGIVAASRDEARARIISASVQTLAQPKRLAKVLAYGPIDYLITDEAHHAVAGTYQAIYEALYEANPSLRHLGVTATPVRGDERKLGEVFTSVAYRTNIKHLISRGYLVRPRWQKIDTNIDLSGVSTNRTSGDYNTEALRIRFETEDALRLIVDTHRRYAAGRLAVVFCISVKGAHDLAGYFCEAGFPAEMLCGSTPTEEREDIIQRFRTGKVEVICNVGVLTEGYDNPAISAIHMARPTKSDGLYMQCMGRGLRLAEGKEECLVFDYAPLLTGKRDMVFVGDILGLKEEEETLPAEQTVEEPREALEVGREEELCVGYADTLALPTLVVEKAPLSTAPTQEMTLGVEVDYLATNLAWWETPDGWLVLGLGESRRDGVKRVLAVEPTEPPTLWGYAQPRGSRQWKRRELLRQDLEPMVWEAEAIANRHGRPHLFEKRSWQEKPASDKQRWVLAKYGYTDPGITKGEAGGILNAAAIGLIGGTR